MIAECGMRILDFVFRIIINHRPTQTKKGNPFDADSLL
jgi:hypothetical protein